MSKFEVTPQEAYFCQWETVGMDGRWYPSGTWWGPFLTQDDAFEFAELQMAEYRQNSPKALGRCIVHSLRLVEVKK